MTPPSQNMPKPLKKMKLMVSFCFFFFFFFFSHRFFVGEVLVELSDDNLKNDLGISAFGHRFKILKAVKKLKEEGKTAPSLSLSPSPASSSSPSSSPINNKSKQRTPRTTYKKFPNDKDNEKKKKEQTQQEEIFIKDDNKGSIDTTYKETIIRDFQSDSLNLKEPLVRGIYAMGFERPSACQQRAILPIIQGRDVIVHAQSGTGKTATFAIGILQRIQIDLVACQALILEPTRELSQQTQKVVHALGDFFNVRCHSCIGGIRVSDDVERLKDGVHIVVGTPGRVFDMLMRKALDSSYVKLFVLDDADDLLSRFKDWVYDIWTALPTNSLQFVLCSATMPPNVVELTERFMNHPVKIFVKRKELTLEGIVNSTLMSRRRTGSSTPFVISMTP